jgi:hypothetical protein
MAGTLGLAGCGREVDRPSWIISAEIGTPHPHVLWVVVAQASVRQPWLPDLSGFSGQHTTTDIRLQTWQVDLPEGRLRRCACCRWTRWTTAPRRCSWASGPAPG